MPVIFNNTQLSKIIFNDTTLRKIIFNNTTVFDTAVVNKVYNFSLPATFATSDVSVSFGAPIELSSINIYYNQLIADDIAMTWNANVRIRNASTHAWTTLDGNNITAQPQTSYNYNKTFTSFPKAYYDQVSIRIYDPKRASGARATVNGYY